MKFQHTAEGLSFPFVPDERFFPRLLEENFIIQKEDGSYTLGVLGEKVFKGDGDLFEEFYSTYPHKVDTGSGFRPVSTASADTVSAKITRSIWDRITKNKPYLQRQIIDNLKKELAHKKAEGSLAYLQGIDTWLRQATWEKWEDIPEKRTSGNNYIKL
jgi:hypothetical protein